MPSPSQYADIPAPEQAIGKAIQDITAVRLGRGFVPLAGMAVAGVVQLGLAGLGSGEGWFLALGAAATAGAMLAFGLRNVQLAFGRPAKPWMSLAMVGSFVPPLFTFYVLAWRGLREVATGPGVAERIVGVLMTLLGLWALRSWMKLVEVRDLARAMSPIVGLDEREVS